MFGLAGYRRFTVDGDEALEGHLEGVCEQAREAVLERIPARWLFGLLLGGAYGRGEGGVVRTPDGDLPYFGMEFVVLVAGGGRQAMGRWARALEEAGLMLESYAGVSVRFWVTTPGNIRSQPRSLERFELCEAHRRLLGPPVCSAGRTASLGSPGPLGGCRLGWTAATRLLLGSGAALLFALERLGRTPFLRADGDAVLRGIAQAQMAVGDAFLASQGLYHVSVRERVQRLQRVAVPAGAAGVQEILQHHGSGAAFALHPHFCSEPVEVLMERLRIVLGVLGGVFLWNERRRLGKEFATVEDYARSPGDKWPEGSGWRCLGLQCRRGRTPGWKQWRELWRHPRQNLLEALAVLLWGKSSIRDPALQRWFTHKLRAPCVDFGSTVRAFRALWNRYG